jgi:phospholipid transport system substrate-binding protein
MIRLPRRLAFGLAAASFLLPGVSRAQDNAVAVKPIQTLYAALLDLMHQGRSVPFPQRFDTLAPIIDQVYDLETVLRVSVGPRWATMDDGTKQALFRAFRNFTIATYVANFDVYEGEKFEVMPNVRSSGPDVIVSSKIIPGKGDPTRIDYVMRANPTWRIVDVLFDGTISRVAVQRSDFRSLLASGDAQALITSLERKTNDLSGGSLHS